MLSIRNAILVGLLAAGMFFFYYAYAIVDGAEIWALSAMAPAFKVINASLGRSYSHLFGYTASFTIGVLGTVLFLLPIRVKWGVTSASVLALTLAIASVFLVTLADGTPRSLEALSVLVQPAFGVAILCVQRKAKAPVPQASPL